MYAIDRHEKPIEGISLANNAYTGATLTRNCVGLWNLENGRLVKTLANSAHRYCYVSYAWMERVQGALVRQTFKVYTKAMFTKTLWVLEPTKGHIAQNSTRRYTYL